MQISQHKLLRLLADGELHSGSELARQLGVTRSAVWKSMQQLNDLGLEIAALKGRGYRLPERLDLLDAERILAELGGTAPQRMDAIEVLWATASTNDQLLNDPAPAPGHYRVCLAEFQQSGRGRRGREWFAVPGHGLCFSLCRNFQASPAQLSCLGLVAGVGVLRAVHRAGVPAAQLKWPNDVVVGGAKLAGILIDVQGEAGGPMRVVVGVGLNYRLSQAAVARIVAAGGLSPAAMVDAQPTAGSQPSVWSRNAVAAALIEELQSALDEFAERGFSDLAHAWSAADYLRGKSVTVSTDAREYRGTVRGIAADGRLQLRTEGGIVHLMTGDVSVRTAA